MAARPTATSTASNDSSHWRSAPSNCTRIPSSFASAFCTWVPVCNAANRFALRLRYARTTSLSASPIICSSASTTVTCDPRARNTVASSRPKTPPPTTSRRFGISSRSKADVESRMRGSSGNSSSLIGREPVAMIACAKRTSSLPCPVSTANVCADTNSPRPVTTSTSRRLASAPRPSASCATPLSFQSRNASKSIRGGSNTTPRSRHSAASSIRPAACSKVLDGIQPTFRHTPPSRGKRSTSITFMPRSAARKAAL